MTTGKPKNKSKNEEHSLGINDMHIEPCVQYKYLGETINTKNNLDDHLQEINRKTEAAQQTVEACIIPIITYDVETWTLNKTQTKNLNTLLDNKLKRLLRILQSTPRECIYKELDILDIQHRIILMRTML